MWSTDFNGRYGAFGAQQRMLFPVRDSSESTKKCLLKALLQGTCTGVAVLSAEDRAVLLLVRQTLQAVYVKNQLLKRDSFTIVVTTSAAWPAETLSDRIHDVVGHLQLETLDVLLLARPQTLATAALTTSQRKQVVLNHWEAMCSIQRRGLARTIGVSDFAIQEIEFIFTATPATPPAVLSVEATIAKSRPAAPTSTTTPDVPLKSMVSFAHGQRMDVLVRFANRSLDDLSPQVAWRDRWRQLVQSIAQRQRAMQFEVQIIHEVESDAYHLEKRDMTDTETLQTGTQIILRYLVQTGVVVVPLPDSDDTGDQFTESETYELFYKLMHPFSSLPPTRSAQVQYSSVLSKENLQVIDQVLPLVVSFTV